MTFDQTLLLLLLALVMVLFVWGKWRYDVVAFSALLVASVLGAIPFDAAFSGFGHPAVITVAAVLILSRGLQNAGAVDLIARYLIPPLKSTSQHVGLLSVVAGGLSGFMNNVGALALLMPAALHSARKAERAPAVILMPLSFGSILGGLVTLIGTPPNIIVAAFRNDAMGAPFSMFDFTPVGGVVAITGIAFIALGGWRLIPRQRTTQMSARELFDIENYVTEIRVPKNSRSIGEALGKIDHIAGKHDAVILGLIRRGARIPPSRVREVIRLNDILIVESGAEGLEALLADLGLKPAAARSHDETLHAGGELAWTEAVIPARSRAVGRTATDLYLLRRHDVSLISVSRQGHAFRGRLRNFRLEVGDVVLLQGDVDDLPEAVAAIGFLPLAERGIQLVSGQKAIRAIAIFAAAVAASTFGLVSLPVGLAAAAACMVILNIVPMREIYDSIDWPVIVLLGAMIPIGTALETSGATLLIANGLLAFGGDLSPVVLLTVVLVLTMTVSDVMNNAATAVVMAPIALGLAQQMGVNPDAFLMAVAVGASCAFLTPIGHQNNALILGPGGYHFGDYWRLGLPLEILIVLVAVPMLLWIWPL